VLSEDIFMYILNTLFKLKLQIINRFHSTPEKANTGPILADKLFVVGTSWTFLRSNHIRVLILLLVWPCVGLFRVGDAQAQISPEGRDRTYKQAAPHRFDRRFGKQPSHKSMVIPLKPESTKSLFPIEQEEVKFVLNHLLIQGLTIYDQRSFKPLYRNLLKKELTLKDIYEIAQKITNKYRNDGYILSKAIVPSQKIDNGV
ncbi:uncharacterized protein METZ01_LOCUS495935, partial [marine metagenome]